MEWWWWGKPDSNRVGLFLIRTRDWDIVFEREVYVCLPGKMRIISRSNDVVRTNKETSLDPVLMNERVKSSFSNLISHRQETTTDILNHFCLLCTGKLIRATFRGFIKHHNDGMRPSFWILPSKWMDIISIPVRFSLLFNPPQVRSYPLFSNTSSTFPPQFNVFISAYLAMTTYVHSVWCDHYNRRECLINWNKTPTGTEEAD